MTDDADATGRSEPDRERGGEREAATDHDTSTVREPVTDQEQAPNTWLNALLGAVVSVLLAFVPFSPVLGGGVAGYLEGGDTVNGAKVGALAGVVAAVPLALAVFLFAAFLVIGTGSVRSLVLFVVVLALVATYTVGASTLGGILGAYVKEEI